MSGTSNELVDALPPRIAAAGLCAQRGCLRIAVVISTHSVMIKAIGSLCKRIELRESWMVCVEGEVVLVDIGTAGRACEVSWLAAEAIPSLGLELVSVAAMLLDPAFVTARKEDSRYSAPEGGVKNHGAGNGIGSIWSDPMCEWYRCFNLTLPRLKDGARKSK